MAKLPRTGQAVSSLYEETISLEQVVADLGLAPLSADENSMIRMELGALIAAGEENFFNSPKHAPRSARLVVADVEKRLLDIADRLEAASLSPERLLDIEKTLLGADTGLRNRRDTEVALRIIKALTAEFGNGSKTVHVKVFGIQIPIPDDTKARAVLRDFRSNPRPIIDACRRAAAGLKAYKGKSGSSRLDWSGFRHVLEHVAKRNGIPPTWSVNPRAEKPGPEGPLIELAKGFERLLPPYMRTSTNHALAKRLGRGGRV
jgi:hypothetical protein